MRKLLSLLFLLPAIAWGQTYPNPTFSATQISPVNVGGLGAKGLQLNSSSGGLPTIFTDENAGTGGAIFMEHNPVGTNIMDARNASYIGDAAFAFQAVDPYAPTAYFFGSISGSTLTVTGIVAGIALAPGQYINGTGVTAGNYILSQTSGTTGGVGVYALGGSQNNGVSQNISTFTYTPTGASGSGTFATITLPANSFIQPGSAIQVSGMSPSAYNGIFRVTSATSTSVTYASTSTGAMTVAGSVQTIMSAGTTFEHLALGYGGFNQAVAFEEFSSFDGFLNKLLPPPEVQFFQTGGQDLNGVRFSSAASVAQGSTAISTAANALFTASISGTTLTISAMNTSTTGASGTGTVATVTFATLPTPLPVGTSVVIAGVTPTGYNGTYVITASTTSSVSYANTTTGAQTVAGTIGVSGAFTYQGMLFTCSGVTADTFITANYPNGNQSGTNQSGLYVVNNSQTVASGVCVGGVLPANGDLIMVQRGGVGASAFYTYPYQSIEGGIPSETTLVSGAGTYSGVMSASATQTWTQAVYFSNPVYSQRLFFRALYNGPIIFNNFNLVANLIIDRVNGRIGIGPQTTPKATLDVEGSTYLSSDVTLAGLVMTLGPAGYSGGSGTSYTVPAGVAEVLLNDSGGTYAALTVTTPANPKPGQILGIVCVNAITALTLNANTGQVFRGGTTPTTCLGGQTFRYKYNQNTVWYPSSN